MDGLAELDALSRQKIMQRLTLQYICAYGILKMQEHAINKEKRKKLSRIFLYVDL